MNKLQTAIQNIVNMALQQGVSELQIIAVLEMTKLDLHSACVEREKAAKTAIVPASASALHSLGGGR